MDYRVLNKSHHIVYGYYLPPPQSSQAGSRSLWVTQPTDTTVTVVRSEHPSAINITCCQKLYELMICTDGSTELDKADIIYNIQSDLVNATQVGLKDTGCIKH